jgi:uncharacterized membrane protein
MSEPNVPPPPSYTPPPPPTGTLPPPGAASPNRGLMLVLSYLWILALVPLVVEKNDPEVQWHAKHGLVLTVAEIILWVLVAIITNIPVLGMLGCVLWLLWPLIIVFRIILIVKAVNGQRLLVPGISEYANRF